MCPGLQAGALCNDALNNSGNTDLSIPDPILPFPEQAPKFYEALGRSLVLWQTIETMLFLISFAFMRTDQATCALSFFQIKSASSKLSFVDKLASHKLDPKTYSNVWRPIKKEVAEIIVYRNHIAHFDYSILNDEGMEKIDPKTKYRYVLSTHFLDVETKSRDLRRIYTIEAILENSNEIRRVSYRLLYFLFDHLPQILSLPEPLEPRLKNWLEGLIKAPRHTGL